MPVRREEFSSSSGSDPWQPGGRHHAGHGHLGTRTGIDVDVRYLNTSGNSFQSANAFTNDSYSRENNQTLFTTAELFGFTKNFQGLSGDLTGPRKINAHNDHGHLGLEPSKLNWAYVRRAPILQTTNSNQTINQPIQKAEDATKASTSKPSKGFFQEIVNIFKEAITPPKSLTH